MASVMQDVIGPENWLSEIQAAAPMVDRALESLAESLSEDGALSSQAKGLVVASIAATKTDLDGCRHWVNSRCGDFSEWRMLAALLFLSRGSTAAKTLLVAAGTMDGTGVLPPTPDSPTAEEIQDYFLEVFGQLPARVTLLQNHAPNALETYFLLRQGTLAGSLLDPMLAQLVLVGVNAADRQEDFTFEHGLGAVKEGASVAHLVEAGVCSMLYGGLASWTTAAAAITRVVSSSDEHTF
jgi:alkylhydroperoxidase/carboxymuconolactone decarboxylase family protein YurZ